MMEAKGLKSREVKSIMKELERRRKIIWVSEQELMSLFVAASVAIGSIEVDQTNLVLPVIKELPKGTLFKGLFYDPMNEAFGLVCMHDLFPVVEIGEQPEFLNGTMDTVHVHAVIQGSQIIGSQLQC